MGKTESFEGSSGRCNRFAIPSDNQNENTSKPEISVQFNTKSDRIYALYKELFRRPSMAFLILSNKISVARYILVQTKAFGSCYNFQFTITFRLSNNFKFTWKTVREPCSTLRTHRYVQQNPRYDVDRFLRALRYRRFCQNSSLHRCSSILQMGEQKVAKAKARCYSAAKS